jgi:two-component system, chemotaxis family, protein-glutamate methylesterase/glutaminase
MMHPDRRPTAGHDIIVIGASAGGIEPLLTLVRDLPSDLPASIFIVVHTPPYAPSRLPEILSRAGRLPAALAQDREAIVAGQIYIAPPDWHLLVRRGAVAITRGARENHTRPAIDPLFRSAARAYGKRVVGVILSGALYDGAAGLLAVKKRDGLAIVQHPGEALVPSMPHHALQLVDADWTLPAADIGDKLGRLALFKAAEQGDGAMVDESNGVTRLITEDFAEQEHSERVDETSLYTCPECGGVLWQVDDGPEMSFRCHVGHAYAPEILLGQKSEELEAALWRCVRLLREKAVMARQTVDRFSEARGNRSQQRARDHARLAEEHALVIEQLLEAMPSIVDLASSRLPAGHTEGPASSD